MLFKRFIRPESNQVLNANCNQGLRFLSRIRLRISYLVDHKFGYNIEDCINPTLTCCQEIETSDFFLLHFPNYHSARQILFVKISKINSTFTKNISQVITILFVFGGEKLKSVQNKSILMYIIEFQQATLRFKISFYSLIMKIQFKI